jgi:hypothetical protein
MRSVKIPDVICYKGQKNAEILFNYKIREELAMHEVLFFFVFETGSPYVAQAGLELTILLSLPPEC